MHRWLAVKNEDFVKHNRRRIAWLQRYFEIDPRSNSRLVVSTTRCTPVRVEADCFRSTSRHDRLLDNTRSAAHVCRWTPRAAN